ncbi:hypothetical protein K435DRAFT_812912 [Dendrothele bispora CBS 962.96]|uniref:Uncharacterized protein n=1 Tax=Dendrothele bispora (strain CBS 962.96) TaxID=1314807 RepID=A0A4S8KN43_DENBC|nr:hypothetical protein K435DRAFT_812912 [Dendrothele bispora CBS 962.96]
MPRVRTSKNTTSTRLASQAPQAPAGRPRARATRASRVRTVCSPTPEEPPSSSDPVECDANEMDADGDYEEDLQPVPNLVELLRNKKPKRGQRTTSKNDLDRFRDAARRFAPIYPYVDWFPVLILGLEEEGIIQPGFLDDADVGERTREKYLELFSLLDGVVPYVFEHLENATRSNALGELATSMNSAVSNAISQDVRGAKSSLLHYLRSYLGYDAWSPPIKGEGTKSDSRGWKHPQLARMLCTPIKLNDFEKNPVDFCVQVRDGVIRINHTHFPAFFYQDLGKRASERRDYCCEGGLLRSPFLIRAWVHLFLGEYNAERYIDGEKARHTLAASNDWRTDDGAVVKRSAFDAILALAEDDLVDEEWIADLLKYWNDAVGFLLPSGDDLEGLEDDDDEDSTLNMLRTLRKCQREDAEKAAVEKAARENAEAERSDAAAESGSEGISAPLSSSTEASSSSGSVGGA